MATKQRSISEIAFLIVFLPAMVAFYLILKYPTWFVPAEQVKDTFYWFGKSTSFWYGLVYTAFVCGMCLKLLWRGKTPYARGNKPQSTYQRNKWISIFLAQGIFFFFVPYILPWMIKGGSFWNDTYAPLNKNAYIYLYNGFTSMGGAIYVFGVVPLSVYFFGKRYCSWFCACGNLAEVVGVTTWGAKWVKNGTPRGKTAEKWEWLQVFFMVLAFGFGLLLLFDAYKIVAAPGLLEAWRGFQDLVVDLMFGALVGIGAYPFLGTRIWCRYGCPLAQMMKVFGKYGASRFEVKANEACKGLNLCTTVCPMGIDVASYAHKEKKPIQGSFGLDETPCVGCGGCIDICPVKALEFKKILNKQAS